MSDKISINISDLQAQQQTLSTLASETGENYQKYSGLLERLTNAVSGKMASNIQTKGKSSLRAYTKLATELKTGADVSQKCIDAFYATDQDIRKQAQNMNQVLIEINGGNSNDSHSNQIVTNIDVNKDYGNSLANAQNYGMKYYGQGTYTREFSKSSFISSDGTDYSNKMSKSCGICCEAMLLSYFGVDVKPGDFFGKTGASADFTLGRDRVVKQYGVSMTQINKDSDTIDSALSKFASDPNSGPLFVETSLYSGNHYVLVVGKNADGSFIVVDPAEGAGASHTTTLNMSDIKRVFATSKS